MIDNMSFRNSKKRKMKNICNEYKLKLTRNWIIQQTQIFQLWAPIPNLC